MALTPTFPLNFRTESRKHFNRHHSGQLTSRKRSTSHCDSQSPAHELARTCTNLHELARTLTHEKSPQNQAKSGVCTNLHELARTCTNLHELARTCKTPLLRVFPRRKQCQAIRRPKWVHCLFFRGIQVFLILLLVVSSKVSELANIGVVLGPFHLSLPDPPKTSILKVFLGICVHLPTNSGGNLAPPSLQDLFVTVLDGHIESSPPFLTQAKLPQVFILRLFDRTGTLGAPSLILPLLDRYQTNLG